MQFFVSLFNLTQFDKLRTFSAQVKLTQNLKNEFTFLDIDRLAAEKALVAIQQVTSERRGATQGTEGFVLHLRRTPGKTDGVARLFYL